MNTLKSYINAILIFEDEELTDFCSLFQYNKLKKDEFFAIEGKPEKKIGFLENGVIRAFYRTAEGLEYNKTFFTGNEFFGAYASVVSGMPNKIYLQALTNCEILEADYNEIKKLFSKYRKIETLARLIAEMFYIEKEKREIELVLLQADELYKIFKKEYPNIENLIPQYHIASYLGITPTQLSRIRAKK